MKAVSGKMLCKIVERNGWELKRISGSHHIYIKDISTVVIEKPPDANYL